jgi:hypothetical protein
MRVKEFELSIQGVNGAPKEEMAAGHVPMAHGEQYAIAFRNHVGDHCNLNVLVDGVSVGDFQIGPYASAILERPHNDTGRFTFFAAGTAEARSAGGDAVSVGDKGLIQVTFTPGRAPEPIARPRMLAEAMRGPYGEPMAAAGASAGMEYTSGVVCDSGVHVMGMNASGFGAGVTGQTGYSGQRFGVARTIVEDVSRRVIITLRLVHDRSGSIEAARLLPGRSTPAANPVPHPVP